VLYAETPWISKGRAGAAVSRPGVAPGVLKEVTERAVVQRPPLRQHLQSVQRRVFARELAVEQKIVVIQLGELQILQRDRIAVLWNVITTSVPSCMAFRSEKSLSLDHAGEVDLVLAAGEVGAE